MNPRACLGTALLLAASGACAAGASPAASIRARPAPSLEARPAPEIVAADIVRIGLRRDLPEALIQGSSALVLFDQTTGTRRTLAPDRKFRFRSPSSDRLEAVGPGSSARISLSGVVRLSPEKTTGRVFLRGKPYRGSLILKAAENGISVINELGLEEYLYGVLPLEMAPDWPPEALKAQAVIARSYAVYNLGHFDASGFDLFSDERSQSYDGSGHEDPRATAAVNETLGQVLTYHGAIINAYFHACCGGHTATVSAIWGDGKDPYRPFQGVRDTFCEDCPYFNWEVRLDASEILQALQRGGFMATKLLGLKIAQRDRSGYVRAIQVKTEQGSELVRANLLRRWIGNGLIRSTNWSRLRRERGEYVIEGHGYGHGVGLCQWGAREQARRGRKYKHILTFYYPGTTLREIEE